MKSHLGFDLKEAWVIASVSVLVVHMIGQLRPDSELGMTATSDWLIVWMLLLSFPASMLGIILISIFIEIGYTLDLSEVIFIWMVMFAAGYLQWFGFIPRMLPKDQMITLKLTRKDDDAFDVSRMEADKAYDSVWMIEEERPVISRPAGEAVSADISSSCKNPAQSHPGAPSA